MEYYLYFFKLIPKFINIMKLLAVALLISCLNVATTDYLGRLCGPEWGHSHFYPSSGSTIRKCIEHCLSSNYSIAGLLFGNECFCQNDFGGYAHCRPGNTSYLCNTVECTRPGIPCRDDPTMTCGDSTWYSIYDSSPELHNVIYYEDTNVDQVCSENDPECYWMCSIKDPTYSFGVGKVIGTVDYDIASSYCLSAVHDLRYTPNAQTAVVVSRKSANEVLEGSWRCGLQSTWKSGSAYQFEIVYPRSRIFYFGNTVLFGFVNLRDRVLNCIKYNMGQESNDIAMFAAEINGELLNSYSDIALPPATMIYCGLNQTRNRLAATYVPVVTQPPGNSDVAPNRTITISEGANLQFQFFTGSISDGPWYVEKAGKILIERSHQSVISVARNPATIQMGGFYHLRYDGGTLAATVRVIEVDGARDLSVCGGNRGTPREDGTCLCIPPFGNASDCSGVCNPHSLDGTFGSKCDMNCGAKQCRGILVCGEDPFGCHCGSGWTGGDCTDPCPGGTFGPDCHGNSDDCKCSNNNGCNKISGLCPSGCVTGWLGSDCKLQGGYLKRAPLILKIFDTKILVGFNVWNKNTDYGDIEPDGYRIQFKRCNESASNYDNFINITHEMSIETVFVTGLFPLTCFDFRLQTIVEDTIMPQASASSEGTTLKQAPPNGGGVLHPYILTEAIFLMSIVFRVFNQFQ